MSSHDKITLLSGQLYYHLLLSGTNKIFENQKDMNKINVFPVPDADTGTNLASTFRSIIDNAIPDISFHTTARAIAITALNGARGNSGVIFALWWGIFLISSGNEFGWTGIISPLIISLLLRFGSGVPMLEKKYMERDYFRTYAAKTPVFIPVTGRKGI